MEVSIPWSEPVRLSQLSHEPLRRTLTADEAARQRIAKTLNLDELLELTAEVEAAPWLDGAQLQARWRARVVQTCGVTLDPFVSELAGEFRVRAVPEGSPTAPAMSAEQVLDPEAEDPPDVLGEDRLDLAAYVVEHLALEVDPYPRKPGVEFEPPEPEPEVSPFAVLKNLKLPDAT
jgi:uncharacterized metal-binding protein YceD (DUF177 family)